MLETDFIVRCLHLATENAESLQRGLSHRQDDVLALEEAVSRLSAGLATGQLVVDRAEDLRRALRAHGEEELPIVRNGLNYGSWAIAEEGRRVVDWLDEIVEALSFTAQASPNDPGLVSLAQRSVDESASMLERTRRAVFRIVEDLPDITNAVRDTSGVAYDPAMGANFGTDAAGAEHPGRLQVHEIPRMDRNPSGDFGAPGR